MLKKSRLSRLFQFLPCLFLLTLAAQAAEKQPSQFARFSFESDSVTLHEPVILEFTVHNEGEAVLHLNLGRDRRARFLLFLTMPSGERIELHSTFREGFSRVGDIDIAPGETYRQQLILNRWFEFKDTGRYTLEAGLRNEDAGRRDGTSPGELFFSGALNIEARDVSALSKRCEALARAVEESSSYEPAQQAALTLSYVTDDVAVPYLRRVLLSGKLVEPIALEALGRIGDHQAVSVIRLGLDLKDDDKAAMTRSIMLSIQDNTTDPNLKEEIQTILKSDPAKSS
ncbi:MAG TPA: hypothetical protein VGI16_14405 [Candidatus Acidoferrum sp.]|jgi:hypothetical protein